MDTSKEEVGAACAMQATAPGQGPWYLTNQLVEMSARYAKDSSDYRLLTLVVQQLRSDQRAAEQFHVQLSAMHQENLALNEHLQVIKFVVNRGA